MGDTLTFSAQTIRDLQNIQNSATEVGLTDWFNIAFLFINAIILCLTLYVIRKTPIDAVKVGRQLNDSQSKDNAKRELFLTLFSLRGSPLDYEFVRSLNKIDVVFEDDQNVLNKWHTHFDSLHQTNLANNVNVWNLQRADLLAAMATSLNYKAIPQTDMLKNYYPDGHVKQDLSDWEFRTDEHSFYKAASNLNNFLLAFYTNGQNPPTPLKD